MTNGGFEWRRETRDVDPACRPGPDPRELGYSAVWRTCGEVGVAEYPRESLVYHSCLWAGWILSCARMCSKGADRRAWPCSARLAAGWTGPLHDAHVKTGPEVSRMRGLAQPNQFSSFGELS